MTQSDPVPTGYNIVSSISRSSVGDFSSDLVLKNPHSTTVLYKYFTTSRTIFSLTVNYSLTNVVCSTATE
ncbi:unnamed protein product [Adineta ricciae]|uniref:Uncharacterized protein n=1 Tax=Adineta ricciae TaxID=249248 RepID=A0A814XZZ3_ADIRI|nr:unnamed protein product [Adineta ricciae]